MDLSEYAQTFAILGTVLFMIQMLSPLPTFLRIVRTGTVGENLLAPYSTAYLSCSIWMLYGWVIHDVYVVQTNIYGAVLQLGFSICYYMNCVTKKNVLQQICGFTIIIMITALYCWYETDQAVLLARMGFFCTCVTLGFFAAPFSNVTQVIKERNASSLPFTLICFTFIVSLMWMLYGAAIEDIALQVTNLIGVILSSIQLFLIAWFHGVKPTTSKVYMSI